MRLPRMWPRVALILLEGGLLALLLWLLVPALPAFSFVLSLREDTGADFSDGSFDRTALADMAGMEGVRLLPMGLAGQWVEDAQLPIALNNLSAVAWADRIFVVGGDDGDIDPPKRRCEVLSTTINADGSLQPWVTLPETSWLPDQKPDTSECNGLSSGALVLYAHSDTTATLYYIGGVDDDGNHSTKVYYAVVTATTGAVGPWRETTPLEDGLIYHSALVIDNYIFVIGGIIHPSGPLYYVIPDVCKASIRPDGSLSNWVCDPNEELPTPLQSSAAVLHTGETSRTIYIVGGNADPWNGEPRNEVWFADVLTTTNPPTPTLTGWITSAGGDLPQTLYAHGAAEVRGELFTTGGEEGLGRQISSTVQMALIDESNADTRLYDEWGPGFGVWLGGPILPEERSRHATVAWEGHIYVIGGNDPNEHTVKTVYRGSVDGEQQGQPLYPPDGRYTSNAIELSPDAELKGLRWGVSLQPDTGLRLRYRYGESLAALVGAAWSDWVNSVEGTNYLTFTPPLSPAAYFQYQIELTRGSVVTYTPFFDWIEILYDVTDPSLSVSKDTYLGIASPGDILDYRIIYSNPGRVDLPQAVITEELPQWTRFVGFGWQQAAGDLYTRTVLVRGGGLLGEARFRIQIEENVPVDYITNTVWIAHPPIQDALGNVYTFPPVSTTYTLRITGARSLFKEAWPPSESWVYWGQPITYTITFSNQYNAEFSTVVISDSINPGLFYAITPHDGGIFSNGTITWTLSNLAPGTSASVRFTARVTPGLQAGFMITNVACSEAYVLGGTRPVLAQESNDVRHYVKGTLLEISKASSPPPNSQVRWDDLITYSVIVTNTGYYTAQNLIITDVVDSGALDIVDSGGGTYQNGTVTWDVGALGRGSSTRVDLVVRVKSGLPRDRVIVNRAYASAASSDVFPSNQVTHTVAGPPSLAVFKGAQPASGSTLQYGDLVTYVLTYENGGDSPAYSVVVTDPIDTSVFSYVTGGIYQDGTVRWDLGTLAPGAFGELSFTVQVRSGVPAGVVTNTAFIAGEGLGILGSPPVTHHLAGPPVLYISKSAVPSSGAPVMPGDYITYTLRYTNTGGNAQNVVVTEKLPGYVRVVDAGGANRSGDTLRWEGLKLRTGESGEESFSVQVNPLLPRCGNYTIRNTDYAIAAQEDYGTVPGQGGQAVEHLVQFPPDLAVGVDDGRVKVNDGDSLVYTISYSNVCGIAVDEVALTLTLGSNLVPGSNPDWTSAGPGTFTRNIGSLEGGAEGQIQFNATVSGLPAESSTGVTVTIGGRGEDWDPGNNMATDWDISGGVDFFIKEISVTPSRVGPGGSVNVHVTVLNQGDAPPQGGYGGEWVAVALYLKPHPSEPPANPADWSDFAEGLCPGEAYDNCYAWIPLADLGPGEEWSKDFTLKMSDTEGIYDLYAQIDVWAGNWGEGGDAQWGYVRESCENNNVASWGGLYVVSGLEEGGQIFLPLVMKQG